MPKFKLGVIKRQVVEYLGEVEVEAPNLTDALRQAESLDRHNKLTYANEDIIDTTLKIGAWDKNGEWHTLRAIG
jgi:hypothetical protein